MKQLLTKNQWKTIQYVVIVAAVFFALPGLSYLAARAAGDAAPSGMLLKLFVFPVCSFIFPFDLSRKYGLFIPFPVLIAAMYFGVSFAFYGRTDLEYIAYYFLAAISGMVSGRLLYMVIIKKLREASGQADKRKKNPNPYRQKKKK